MSELENAPTVDREEEQREEAQAWIDQKGGLVYVVNLFKDLANEAVNTRNFVLRTQRDLVDCQQELSNCENNLGLYRNFLTMNGIDLKSGEKQGGRKKRKKRTKKKALRRKRKTGRGTRRR